jgi:hypothetical protein
MIPDTLDAGLSARLPPFRRARDYRLYAVSGRRYLDLWQADGHAILGHRAARVGAAAKSLVSRGLLHDLPSTATRRLERLLRELLPSHPFVRLYRDVGGCLRALSAWSGRGVGVSDVVDPAMPGPDAGGEIRLWRPFLKRAVAAHARALVPVLPFAICGGPWAVCFDTDPGTATPVSEVVSPLALEGVAGGILGLRRYTPGPMAAALADPGSPNWLVEGVYVAPRFAPSLYPEVFDAFLTAGVVLSPRWGCPSILPALLSDGEMARAVGLFRQIPPQ